MTTATHPDTAIVADDTIPAIRITREFNAPVENVFRAHTDPEHRRRMELRVGRR